MLAAGSEAEREALLAKISPLIESMTIDGAEAAFAALGFEFEDLLSQVNEHGLAWAKERAAELVGKKWVDGHLVDNPNSKWVIDETTRTALREMTTKAYEEGISNAELADRIEGAFAFSESRASMIARTETAFADVEGNKIAWKESGVVEGKEWSASPDCCDECGALDGKVVPLSEDFPGGDPPLHPNCVCDILPVIAEESEAA